MKRQNCQTHAFTFIELLAVAAIIAVLTGLSFAAFAKAKSKAVQIQCANNVRQLGFALQQFLGDNHVYPLYGNGDFASGKYKEHSTSWISALQRNAFSPAYQKDFFKKGVWVCPGAVASASDGLYGYNAFGMSPFGDTNSLGLGGRFRDHGIYAPPVAESEVVVPVDAIAIGDNFMGNNDMLVEGGALWRMQPGPQKPATPETTRRINARHSGKANISFCDGHVESPSLKSLFQDSDNAALSRWNRDHEPHAEKLTP
jgi:prepilin-type processing-associated H-X9-DG protein/prepilin-type N-terminal cleavage/methylation domain-containing protein